MKRFLVLITLLNTVLLSNCRPSAPGTLNEPTATPIVYKAVYLTNGLGELPIDDLKSHPEVIVTLNFDEFKSHAESKIALWIDKNAVNFVDEDWLNLPPQKYYPIVLVGYNDPLYCFRDILSIGRIQGPYVDWSNGTLEPGFCVWMILIEKSGQESSFFRGYQQTPTVQEILDITDPLLEEEQDIQPDG